MITPMEIHNKEFSRKVRGYDQDEVDEFLDKIIIDYEKLYKENSELKDKLNLQNEKMTQYINIEDTLQKTLITAQKASEEIEKNAREKADLIIKEAEIQAKQILSEANNEIIFIMKNKEKLMKDVKVLKTKIKTLLESQLEILDEVDQLNDKDGKIDNIEEKEKKTF
ncbi:DivIVA domain-containing protein [Garciella nitratireducens]|uniref:Cell division initiation protein n=1 Tax=Garciella nitratireducens DSM 15102 TaxID=1121911 RepID=A0A1T4JZX3_9FIRM|nr:DivIVA domain-containing protein [Garciella nitratireducens]RBP39188.1 cell division initiation protein [Garciella nitratireducens]SJZ35617.1 cell division initiation protein [Garciella nitratireducens DSM 15102]